MSLNLRDAIGGSQGDCISFEIRGSDFTAEDRTDEVVKRMEESAPAELEEFTVAVPQNRELSERIKRIIDVVFSSMLLLLLSPILIGAAIAVKFSSPGPVFYSQVRAGLGNRRFRMLKFRSMRVASGVEMRTKGVINKIKDHPRVTIVGRIIRKTSIDELPQLFNVLWGEMSLIGPRPLVAEMALALEPRDEQFRVRMRPGLTGLWQIRDRVNSTSAHSMIAHDREYIENFSLWLDFTILLRTIPAVLSCRGAV